MEIWTVQKEAEELAKRFAKVNRAKFARDAKLRGNSALKDTLIYQHVTGRRPISLEAALSYAEGFGVGLEKISPRLAAEAASVIARTTQAVNDNTALSLTDELAKIVKAYPLLNNQEKQLILETVSTASERNNIPISSQTGSAS